MKKNFILTAIAVVFFNCYNAQVGVNTGIPKATLDVIGEPSNPSKLDGIIAPRITGDLLRAKTYAADQNGAVVYVTTADSAPAGQTIDVVSEGYYYYSFPANKWIKMGAGAQANDWHITGNADSEISTASETLGSAPASTNYLGAKGTNDDLVLVSGGNTRAVLDTSGTLKGGGTDGNSYLMWGNQNTATKLSAATMTFNNAIIAGYKNSLVDSNVNPSTGGSATILLGKENTVTYNGVAIGYKNSMSNGLAFGSSNNGSGIIIGSKNTHNLTGVLIGSNFTPTPYGSSIVAANATGSGTNIYASRYHFFQSLDISGTIEMSKIGVNVVPTSTQESDVKISKAIQIVGNGASTTTCNANNEGSIRYTTTTAGTTYGIFEGCRRTNSAGTTFLWTTLN